jgi:hypothetical protein
MLHDGSNLPAAKGAGPANTQQIDEPGDTSGLNFPHCSLIVELAKKCFLVWFPGLSKQKCHYYGVMIM